MPDRGSSRESSFRWSESECRAIAGALEECQAFEIDLSGAVTRWIAGSPSDAESGARQFSDFFTERDRDRGWPQRMLDWARSAQRCKDEGWRLRHREQRFWAEHVIAAIRDDSGSVTGFANLLFDADRRLSAEKALQEADRRILEYQRIARLGSFEWDAARDEFLVTPEVFRILGLARPPARTADFASIRAADLLGVFEPASIAAWDAVKFSSSPERFNAGLTGARYVEIRSEPLVDREGNVIRRMGTIQELPVD